MQVSLDLGKIDITDIEVAKFIQNKSVDEIKMLFLSLLKNQISTTKVPSSDLDRRLRSLKVVNPEKGRRVREALDSLNQKLEPFRDSDIALEKENYFKEKYRL